MARALRVSKLQVLSGPLAGCEHEFSSQIIIGRAGADVEIMDPEISRHHLRLTPVAGGVEVADLGSSNGTWVEGRRLSDPVVLTVVTNVRVGQTKFELVPRDPGGSA